MYLSLCKFVSLCIHLFINCNLNFHYIPFFVYHQRIRFSLVTFSYFQIFPASVRVTREVEVYAVRTIPESIHSTVLKRLFPITCINHQYPAWEYYESEIFNRIFRSQMVQAFCFQNRFGLHYFA